MLTDDASSDDLETYFLPCGRSLSLESFLSDEVSLVHLDEDGKQSFLRGDGIVHLMSVKRHSGFKSQGISCAESAGDETLIFAGFHKCFPDVGSLVPRHVDLNAFFAGIAGGGDHYVCSAHGDVVGCCIVLCRNAVIAYQLSQDLHGFRTLKRYLSYESGNILNFDVSEDMSFDPGEVLILVGSIYYHQEFVLVLSVDDEVVHNSAILVAHRGVSCLTVMHSGIIVGKKIIQVCDGIRTLDGDLAHVGYVKNTAGSSYSVMFCNNSRRVLYRHFPACEGYHFAAVFEMRLIE